MKGNEMGIESKLTAKCQTTIPVEIRDLLKIGPGDRISYVIVDGEVQIIPRNRPASALFGRLAAHAIPNTTLQDYKDAIGAAMSQTVIPTNDVNHGKAA